MEGEGSRELDLAGMILHCREDITRIGIEIGRLEEERTEREADMEACGASPKTQRQGNPGACSCYDRRNGSTHRW